MTGDNNQIDPYEDESLSFVARTVARYMKGIALLISDYVRVSTNSDDQVNSFEAQMEFFEDEMGELSNYRIFNIYADEGISGTSLKKREAFNRMVEDAKLGKFNLIITKEVSRFARNMEDGLRAARELKEAGVNVIFLLDELTTFDNDYSTKLGDALKGAQHESSKTSKRVSWGLTRRMKKGKSIGGVPYGYARVKGVLHIVEKEAIVVRLIFHKYLNEGKGVRLIKRELEEAGVLPPIGSCEWQTSTIGRILKNVKYCGDLVQGITYIPDYLTHQKITNHGERPFYEHKNTHSAIIEKDIFDKTQAEIKRRNALKKSGDRHSSKYAFSGKIRCQCGKNYVAVKDHGSSQRQGWVCSNYQKNGREHTLPNGNVLGCNASSKIRDDVLKSLVNQIFLRLIENREQIKNEILTRITKLVDLYDCNPRGEARTLKQSIARIEKKLDLLIDLYTDGGMTKQDYFKKKEAYEIQARDLRIELQKSESLQGDGGRNEVLSNIAKNIDEILTVKKFDDAFYSTLIREINVVGSNTLEFCINNIFGNGIVFRVPLFRVDNPLKPKCLEILSMMKNGTFRARKSIKKLRSISLVPICIQREFSTSTNWKAVDFEAKIKVTRMKSIVYSFDCSEVVRATGATGKNLEKYKEITTNVVF